MVSEDSQEFAGLLEVHRLSDFTDLDQSIDRQVSSLVHQLDDQRELFKVDLLRCSQRVLFKERHNDVSKIAESLHAIPKKVFSVVVVSPIAEHLAASKELDELFEDISARGALHDREFRSNLPTKAHLRTSKNRRAKTTLSVDEPYNPAKRLESFLLVFRTRNIVTD